MCAPDPDARILFHQCLPALDAATPCLVQQALRSVSVARAARVQEDLHIVLTEAINNIVEHAYLGDGFGAVGVQMALVGACLRVDVMDWGRPCAVVYDTALPPDPAALCESGYGCFLIGHLASRVIRSRCAGQNQLTLLFDLEPRAPR